MNRKSLRQAEIKHILKLQELFYNRFLNEELLNQLVSLYVKAIGSLGENLSLMKVYFLQKMQFLLSRPEIQKLLTQEESEKSTRDKYTIKISSIELEYQCDQYVKKSSLHSQPVGKKLSEMSDDDEKIRERESRIRNQLELMREIELSLYQIPLQKRHKQSNYVPSNKIRQSDFEEEQVSLSKKASGRKRVVRKNSDSFESKNQVHEMFDGKDITKEYLLEIQKQTNSKVDHLNLNGQIQYPSLGVDKGFNGRNFKFGSIYMKENDERQQGLHKIDLKYEEDLQNAENCWRIQQDGFGTFAEGLKTPQFSESSSSSPTKNIKISFPKPMDRITGVTGINFEEEKQQDNESEGLMVEEQESVRDYADDDYF